MSCYVVSTDAIDLLVTAATATDASIWDARAAKRHNARQIDPTDFGRALLEANVASYTYRYADSITKTEMADLARVVKGYRYTPVNWPASAAVGFYQQTVRTSENYDYQSCEHPAWGESLAALWSSAIRDGAVKRLPGMADAHWDWSRGNEAMTYADHTRAMMRRGA